MYTENEKCLDLGALWKKPPCLNGKNKVADEHVSVCQVTCHSMQTHKEEEIISFILRNMKALPILYSIHVCEHSHVTF